MFFEDKPIVNKIISWILCLSLFVLAVEYYLGLRGAPLEKFPKKVSYFPEVSGSLTGWRNPSGIELPSYEGTLDKHAYEKIWENRARASRPHCDKPCQYRVLVLGCSCTYGMGVNDNETYVWKLGERFPKVNFDNFATIGYSTYQCFLRMRELLPVEHYDLVIYAAYPHHTHRNLYFALVEPVDLKASKDRGGMLYVLNEMLLEMFYCPTVSLGADGELVEHPIPMWFGDKYFRSVLLCKRYWIYRDILRKRAQYDNPNAYDYRRQVYWRLLGKMSDFAHSQGSDFAVFCLCNDDSNVLNLVSDKELERWSRGGTATKVLGDYKIPYYFAGDGLDGHKDAPEFHVGGDLNWHLNEKGHNSWARHIGDQLEKMLPPECVKP